jgi:methyl-accepting chemotaxis protein
MENLDKYEELLKILTEEVIIDGKKYLLKDEFEKFFIKDNQSAGKRIRKIMQEIRNKSKEIRKAVQEHKNQF